MTIRYIMSVVAAAPKEIWPRVTGGLVSADERTDNVLALVGFASCPQLD